MSRSIIVTIFLLSVESLRFPVMTETGFAALLLLAALLQDTAMTGRHWKFFGAVQMAHTMPARSCMVRFAALHLTWDIAVSLPTRWNLKAEFPYDPLVSGLMDKQAVNNGQVLGAEITMSARRK